MHTWDFSNTYHTFPNDSTTEPIYMWMDLLLDLYCLLGPICPNFKVTFEVSRWRMHIHVRRSPIKIELLWEVHCTCIFLIANLSRAKIVCAPSENSNQPAHPHCLIRVFAGYSVGSQGTRVKCINSRVAMTLMSLSGCRGWYDSSLGAHPVEFGTLDITCNLNKPSGSELIMYANHAARFRHINK